MNENLSQLQQQAREEFDKRWQEEGNGHTYHDFLSFLSAWLEKAYEAGKVYMLERDAGTTVKLIRAAVLKEVEKKIKAFDVTLGPLGNAVHNPLMHVENVKQLILAAIQSLS